MIPPEHTPERSLWMMATVLFKVTAVIILIMVTASFVRSCGDFDMDGTDDLNLKVRSGLKLYIDHGTGCEYVQAPGSGLTPRLNASGRQKCQ